MRCSSLGCVGRALAWAPLIISLVSSPVHAAQPTTSDVERLIKRGNELRTAGKDHQALPLYQNAYEVAPTPRTAAQLGLCEMALNYWLAADGHLSEALTGRGDWIDKNRSAIEMSLRQVQGQIGARVDCFANSLNVRVDRFYLNASRASF